MSETKSDGSSLREQFLEIFGNRTEEDARAMLTVFQKLMSYYRCAMMEVETKFRVLNEEFSLQHDRNPINAIHTRLKSGVSIKDKLQRRNLPNSIEAIEENLEDIAGIRVVCAFSDDVYYLEKALLEQDDITLIRRKDYISNPKPNGYRSLHLIIAVPIFLSNQKRLMKVEVQLRTIAMDSWASLEHQLRYKKEIGRTRFIESELSKCAELSNELDTRMNRLRELLLSDISEDGGTIANHTNANMVEAIMSKATSNERIKPAPIEMFQEKGIKLPTGWEQLHFNRVLVKNAEIFKTFSPYLAKTVSHSILDSVDREILIFRTCALTGEVYEKTHHLNIAQNAGMSKEKILAAENADANGLNDHELLLCQAAEELVTYFCLSDDTFKCLSAEYSDEEIIEITSVVASYVVMAMYTRSFGIQLEDETLMNSFQRVREYR